MRSKTLKAILFNTIPPLLCLTLTIVLSISLVDLDFILPATISLIVLFWVTLGGYLNGIFFNEVKNYVFALPLIASIFLFIIFVFTAGIRFAMDHNGNIIDGLLYGLFLVFATGAFFAIFLSLISIAIMIIFVKIGKRKKR